MFEVGDKVNVKASWWRNSNVGTIIQCRHDKYILLGKIYDYRKYYIQIGRNYFNWFEEEDLESIEPTLDKQFEINLLDQLIDINLANGNFEQVKVFNEQKQQLLGGM